MTVAVKIFKTILILALLVAVVLVFWFGIFGSKAAVDPPIPEPSGLSLYPTDLVAETGWKPNFSLVDFIDPNSEGYKWDQDGNDYFFGEFVADPKNPGKEVYGSDRTNIVSDAINLIRLGSYNENNLPYFAYYTDAGGSADIAGAVKGNLMSQTIHVQTGGDYFHQSINAIVQDPDFKMDATVVTAAEAILNKARRELVIGTDKYFLTGAFPQYLVGEDYVDEKGEVVLVNGQPTTFEDGRCTANWSAAVVKSKVENKPLPEGLDSSTEFRLKYRNKYIMSLNPTDYVKNTDVAPKSWFDASKTIIEKVYVDENGQDANSATDHWYIRVVAEAALPARPENATTASIASWAEACRESNLNKALGIANPIYNDKTRDFTPQYLNDLQGYTGATGVCFTALKYTFEIWDCGVMKSWRTDEGWYGTLVMFTGDVQPYNPTTYTYNSAYSNAGNFKEYLKIADENAAA